MSQEPSPFSADELAAIGPILMGAAAIDGEYDGSERDAIEQILREVAGDEKLPGEVLESLVNFDESSFDLGEACEALALESPGRRRGLLLMVAGVMKADAVYHVTEEAYFLQLAELIGSEPDEHADLTELLEELPAWKA